MVIIIVRVRVRPQRNGGGGGGGRRRRVAARPRAAPIPWWRPRRILLGVAVGVASGARGGALRREDGRDGDAPGGCESEDRGVVGDLRTPEARRGGDEGQGARGKGQGQDHRQENDRGASLVCRGRKVRRRWKRHVSSLPSDSLLPRVHHAFATRSPRVHHAFTTRSPRVHLVKRSESLGQRPRGGDEAGDQHLARLVG